MATTVLHSPVPAIGPRPCIQVTHKGGRGVESVQCSGQNIILRSCCCCCHGALVSLVGPSLGVLGGSQAPASQTSTWSKGLDSRRSLSLAHHQPAQPDDSDAIRFSDRSMPPIVFPSFSSVLSFTTVVGHLMGDEVWIRVEQRHTTVSPRNPFCVAWGGSGRGRGVHRVVDVGHAEYRAGGRLAAECTLHCWHTLLCNCWHSALHTSCRLERHTVGTAWIAAREVGRVEARIAAAMARPRGDGGAGGGRATQCNSHLPICLQCPATSYMSAMDATEHNHQKLDKSGNSA